MIVDNIQQIQEFNAQSVFLYPILRDDRLHNTANSIIGFVCIDVDNGNVLTIPNGHPEGVFNLGDFNFLENCKVYCHNKVALEYAGYDTSNFIDTLMQYYLYTGVGFSIDTPSIVNHYNRQYHSCYRINELISLYKHEEIALSIFEQSWVKSIQPGLSFYQEEMVNAFVKIEQNGIAVDVEKFTTRFGKNLSLIENKAYTHYNFFTTTGRPSNRFDGVNFAALNKEDDTREVFVSRFEDGQLVEIDFNSYHPRLIAQIVDYDFGSENAYKHLACYYYNTENPTQDQIEEAKEKTFRQLYGGIQQQYLHIPFFNKTNDMAQYLWSKAKEDGYLESPISGRRLILSNYRDLNAYTLFNYFVQMYETETNTLILKSLHEHLSHTKILPVLYTYDSVLFDTHKEELDQLITKIIPQCVDLKKFPIKIKYGSTYKNLSV